MPNSANLISARFLILTAHFAICVALLWNNQESVNSCLPRTATKISLDNHLTQWVIGLSIMITLLSIEMLAFLIGLTIFNSISALLSICGHGLSCFFLAGLILNHWQCGWFWWIFSFGSVIPFLYDCGVIINVVELSVPCPGWTKLLILTCVTTTFGLILPVGYNIGVVNTPGQIIKAFINESVFSRYGSVFNESQVEWVWSLTVSIFLVGAAVGSLGGAILADRIGRKGALLVSSVLAVIAAVLFFGSKAANSFEIVILARVLVGLSSGLSTSVVPMYLTELAPLHLKGATGVLFQLGVTIGVLLGQIMSLHNILGTDDYWPHCLALYALPLFVCTAILPILPESPKYLYVIKKQPEVALKLLEEIRSTDRSLLQEEIEELNLENQDNSANSGTSWTLRKVILDNTLLLPLTLVCCLQAGQQLMGINAVFYYSNEIFESAGLSLSARELATIGAGCCNLFVAILSVYVMSKVNRRLCLKVSLISSALFLVILGTSIQFMNSNNWVPYISIVGVLGFVTCYGIGMGPIPYFIGSELFEVGPRPSAMALGGMCNWGSNFIIGLTFPVMRRYIGPPSFYIFAIIAIALCTFIWFYLPETKDRDPSEIAQLCKNGFKHRPVTRIVNRKLEQNKNSVI